MIMKKYVGYLCAILLFVLNVNSFGISWTYSDPAGPYWDVAANWDLLREPTSTDKVWIGRDVSNPSYKTCYMNKSYEEINTLEMGGSGIPEHTLVIQSGNTLYCNASNRDINIGIDGPATLIIESGATLEHSRWNRFGRNSGGEGTVDIYGTYYTPQRVDVGFDGGTGTVNIYDGGTFEARGAAFNISTGSVINLYGGQLIRPAGNTSELETYIANGKINIPDTVSYNITDDGTDTVLQAVPRYYAASPKPSDEKFGVSKDKYKLSWKPGTYTIEHRIYIGTDRNTVENASPSFIDGDASQDGYINLKDVSVIGDNWLADYAAADFVTDGTVNFLDYQITTQNWGQTDIYKGTTDTNSLTLQEPLEPGETYYWRIDQITASDSYTGEVWEFTVEGQATDPDPVDLEEGLAQNGNVLSWQAGPYAQGHRLYLGIDKDTVANAEPDSFEDRGYFVMPDTDYNVQETLFQDETYYWRVDVINDDGTVIEGPVWSFAVCDYSLDYDIQGPDTLYAIDFAGLSHEELITITSLQGLLARDQAQMYLYKAGVNDWWLTDLQENYDVDVIDVESLRGTMSKLEWALTYFAGEYSGYIKYDNASNASSLNVASSLAGRNNAIIVDSAIEYTVNGYGVNNMIMDVSTRDEQWLVNNYGIGSDKGIIVKDDHLNTNYSEGTWTANRMHDFSAATDITMLWDSDYSFTSSVYSQIVDNSPSFGWSDPSAPGGSGELDVVEYHGDYGMYTVPSAGILNLSTFASMSTFYPSIKYDQKAEKDSYTTESNVHYVTFINSDMDNITQLLGNNMAISSSGFGNQNRGDFAYGWGMAPSMVKLAPSAMKWWYENATENDYFVVPFSGTGYMNPSDFQGLSEHCDQLDRFLERGDLKHVVMADYDFDNSGFDTAGNLYSQMNSFEGAFMAGNPYHEYRDEIKWYNNKPFIGLTYSLWSGMEEPTTLPSTLNSRPTNPNSIQGYSAVMVHEWSYGFGDVKYVVDRLDSDVRVVTPDEFIWQIQQHGVGK